VRAAGDRVLLLHGIGRSPASLAKLERGLAAAGFETLNLGYKSRTASLDQLADQVRREAGAFLDRNDGPLHIVTHSMGGLVARALIAKYRPASLGRVVMLGPPNQGSEIADLLHRTWLYRRFYGPAGAQLITGPMPRVDFSLGVIAGDRSLDPFCWLIIPGPNDGKVSVARTAIGGMDDHAVLHATHTFMARNARVLSLTIRFLRRGRFDADG
jgi:alpha-beta hydrolase superfamily lysophospholipase